MQAAPWPDCMRAPAAAHCPERNPMTIQESHAMNRCEITGLPRALAVVIGLQLGALLGAPALADETCNSPYITNLIKGQEDYIHVWTLGVEGLGDGSDKLVTVDVNPASSSYGKVVGSVSVGGSRRGAPHGIHGRPALPVGRWARRQPHLRVRRGHESRKAETGADDHRPGRAHRLHRPAHLLRAAGPHADRNAVEHQRQGRRDRARRVQQQGQVHRPVPDAHDDDWRRAGRRLRLRRGGESGRTCC